MNNMTPPTLPITIRRATPTDLPALIRLAALDSQRLTSGPFLMAERSDTLVAALDTAASRTFADPFQPTADVVSLLQERALQLHHTTPPHHSRRLLAARA